LTATGIGTTQDVHRLQRDNSVCVHRKVGIFWADVAEWGNVCVRATRPITARLWMSAVATRSEVHLGNFTRTEHPIQCRSPWRHENPDDESGASVATAGISRFGRTGKQSCADAVKKPVTKPVFIRIPKFQGPRRRSAAPVLRKRWRTGRCSYLNFFSSRDPDNFRCG